MERQFPLFNGILARYWLIYLTAVRYKLTDLADATFRRVDLVSNAVRVQSEPRVYRRRVPVIGSATIVTGEPSYNADAHTLVTVKGVGDLMVIRRRLRRYSLGAITHVESVMKGERRERQHVAGSSIEESMLIESEVTTSTEKDLETRTSTEVSQEIEKEMTERRETEASITATASYGAVFSSGSATVSQRAAGSSEAREAQRSARRTMQETVSRAVERVEKRKLTRTTLTTRTEQKETNTHSFEGVAENTVGTYRELLEHSVCRSYNYGARLFVEFTVPEPAAVLLFARDRNQGDARRAARRKAFRLKPTDLTPDNYYEEAKRYGVVAEPPPLEKKVISRYITIERINEEKFDLSDYFTVGGSFSFHLAQVKRLTIDFCGENIFHYADKEVNSAYWLCKFGAGSDATANAGVGITLPIYKHFDPELKIAGERLLHCYVDIGREGGFNFLMEIELDLTKDALERWQASLYGKILEAVEEAGELSERRSAALAAGDFRRQLAIESDELIRAELRRGCVEVLRAGWGEDRDQASPDVADEIPDYKPGDHAKKLNDSLFFERMFEWSAMTFTLLPYHVSWMAGGWVDQLSNTDTDPLLAKFLRSGGAQVLVPVERGQEAAFLHYRRCGRLWSGPGTPLPPERRLLAGLAEIVVAAGLEPGKEEARPEGEPWSITMRTGLSVLDCKEAKEVILPVFAIPDDTPFLPGLALCKLDAKPYNEWEWPDSLAVCNALRKLGYDVPLLADATAADTHLRGPGAAVIKTFQQHAVKQGVAAELGVQTLWADGVCGACTLRVLSAAVRAEQWGEWELPR
jgi:hypothetical protein